MHAEGSRQFETYSGRMPGNGEVVGEALQTSDSLGEGSMKSLDLSGWTEGMTSNAQEHVKAASETQGMK